MICMLNILERQNGNLQTHVNVLGRILMTALEDTHDSLVFQLETIKSSVRFSVFESLILSKD